MSSHVIGIPFSAWGHTRPAIAFFVQLLRLDPQLSVTLITAESIEENCRLELARQLASESLTDDNRMSIVALKADMFQGPPAYLAPMKEAYSRIVKEHPPQLVLVDLGFVPFIEFIRKLAPGPVKVAAWWPIMTSLFLAPPQCYFHEDGAEDFTKKIQACMATEGAGYLEAGAKCWAELIDGRRIDIPGLPQISDYECYVQEPPFTLPAFVLTDWVQGLKQVDIVVTSSAHAIEHEAIESIAQTLKKASGVERVLAVGPFLSQNLDKETADTKAADVDVFLDRMVQEKGERSVLYISFGSMFYPAQPAMVHTVLRVLLELGIPYVLVHRAEMPPLPDDLREAMETSGIAFVCKWAPQEHVLSHCATGWFLSHCGLNSVLESLSLGVPIIGWPIFADQPLLSILVSQRLGCGLELSEVRQGFGLKYRESTGTTAVGTLEAVATEARQVFSTAFFDEKARASKEDGAKRMAKALAKAWKEDGDALRDSAAFLEFAHGPSVPV